MSHTIFTAGSSLAYRPSLGGLVPTHRALRPRYRRVQEERA